MTQPKARPAGSLDVPWFKGWLEREHSGQTLWELAAALGRARKLQDKPPEKHRTLDALLAQMVKEKKGKMTAGMRAVMRKGIRA